MTADVKRPLIAFAGLVHFRIALASFVFGEAGRRNNRGIDKIAM
jgi:hypothetical protein